MGFFKLIMKNWEEYDLSLVNVVKEIIYKAMHKAIT